MSPYRSNSSPPALPQPGLLHRLAHWMRMNHGYVDRIEENGHTFIVFRCFTCGVIAGPVHSFICRCGGGWLDPFPINSRGQP